MVSIFLLLGSNLGDRAFYLKEAIKFVEKYIARVKAVSSVYETQSWGKTNLPDYLNQVLQLESDLDAHLVLTLILDIERKMGRRRDEKWGSRIIDIDLLLYGDQIINTPDLVVPHPELHRRRFTLEPLAEIAPGTVHPVFGKTIFELKTELEDQLIVKKL
jgi:2-amino-4-hydroxy-6-hydroxymethyldihydropteridine diphosphokinase